MSWFLYLIECADDSVYTGITTDVAARFDEHASGKGARYTRSRKPRTVLASFPLPDRSIASRAEYWVKRLTAAQKRELAAGIRTLQSVLPAGMSIDGNVDAAGMQDGTREKKKVKAKRADIATQPADTEKAVGKAAKNGTAGTTGTKSRTTKTAKPGRAATAPKSAKAAPAASKRARTADDAKAKKTALRGTPAKPDKPAANAAPKRNAPATGGKPAANGLAAPASVPARGRRSATKATAELIEAAAAPARRATGAKRAKAVPSASTLPTPARKKTTARATPRTKQNRAAS
ncbi:GIY-YIG nuclease family protein [Burkholderia sp. Bp9143]|uniref:GIY-YIG nuclease family protein n=1 Tax=Burkholderia sp. Bp9143 TaxID=2184574 RepID=UPI000F5A6A75|nr:GIY-YIG nuclease family protein [Burkholderia sp. Bp9143]RQR31137.1 GIY-YIG nuclease family protein [Burkholderia sp. Bp9143]